MASTGSGEDDTGGGAGPVRSLSAVTLATADMASSVAFYDALGFVRAYGGPDTDFTSYHVGATSYLNLQLDPEWAPPARVWGRTIVWVDDVDAIHDRAVAAGYRPSTTPADAPWGERYFHVLDPAGHELSVARPLA
ncbi:VOC family protein [Rhabdothermincola salaria]|uniref:VOC family protein n=1 Tax=Rhabdothermincola salaria TaxID=2903142 RepID=UPI001E55C470|nr:VOC family protein [Rhabdothermincola salaria]MCD9624753.1 VOC family protein [Rhabdothermincola salaria]